MIKNIKLDGKIVKFNLFLPKVLKEFLSKNKIDKNKLLNNENWTDYLIEDLEEYEIIDFNNAKVVINYIHIDYDKQIRINPKDFSKGKDIGGGTISKGGNSSISENFSLGYSIFIE